MGAHLRRDRALLGWRDGLGDDRRGRLRGLRATGLREDRVQRLAAPLREHANARSYEARTQALDADSRAHFIRYWRVVHPGVAIVMRAFLAAVAKEVR